MRVIFFSVLLAGCGASQTQGDASFEFDAGAERSNCQESYRQCEVEFRFRALDEDSVQLRGDFNSDGWTVGVFMRREGADWVARVPVGFGVDVQYKFLINNSIWVNDPMNALLRSGNSLRVGTGCAQFSCPHGAPEVGAFDWRDSVMAFVFVDRFADADPTNNCTVPGVDFAGQYQGGDWKGVTQKINEGYFDELGINTLWLTVPVKNATVGGRSADGRIFSAYHGYWPVELERYESCFGTPDDLLELVETAHGRHIQVLFDFAMVHVHQQSSVYLQHPDWFWPLPLNGNECVCGDDQSACPWNSQGLRCWFTDYLPHWNYSIPQARAYSVQQAVSLLEETGADGFRLDAIKHVDPSWLLSLRAEVEKLAASRTPRPRMYLVGETYDFGNRDYLKSFVEPKTKLDGQFDFPLRLQLLESIVTRRAPMSALRDFVESNDSFYGPNALMSPWVGNHDLGRVIHMAEDTPVWGPYSDGKGSAVGLPTSRRPFERLANAFVFLLTSPGVPLLYYGDEIGLPGAGDPDNRRFMQWGGLSLEQEWLRNRFRTLGQLRKEHSALRRGKRTSISANDNTYVYSMSDGSERLYVVLNRGDVDEVVSGLPARGLSDLYNGVSVSGPSVLVPARSSRVLK